MDGLSTYVIVKISRTYCADKAKEMHLDVINAASGRWQHHRAAGAMSAAESSCVEVDVIVDS